MRHLYKNLVLVVLSYSLALSSPAAAQSSNSFDAVKGYVNGSGKKSFKALFQKMDKGVPSNFYEEALKKVKGPEGGKWFDAAKLATNYSYFRIGNSKIFIRTALEKGQTVFYANGMKIMDQDFRNLKRVENILYVAYIAGYSAPKKTSFIDLFDLDSAQASPGDRAEVADGGGANATPQVDECDAIRSQIRENPSLAAQLSSTPKARECGIAPIVNTGTTPGATGAGMSNQDKIALAIFAIIFLLMLMKRNKKKAPSEKPEDQDCVGRGGIGCDDDDDDDDDGGGHVNCGGDGAQCPGGTPPTEPAPGEPTPPPTGGGSEIPTSDDGSAPYDPNQYAVPMSKTKGKRQ